MIFDLAEFLITRDWVEVRGEGVSERGPKFWFGK